MHALQSFIDIEDLWQSFTIGFEELPESLYRFAERGHLQLSSFTVKHKLADINTIREYRFGRSCTALNAACYRGHESIVVLLLDLGADPFLGNTNFCCALEAASVAHEEAIASILLDKDADLAKYEKIGYRPLPDAASLGYEIVVRRLLHLGADVNARTISGRTALYAVAAGGYVSIVKLLSESKADIHARESIYDNAVQAAAAYGQTECVSLLLEYGAKVGPPGPEWERLTAKSFMDPMTPARLRKLQARYGEANRRGELTKHNQ